MQGSPQGTGQSSATSPGLRQLRPREVQPQEAAQPPCAGSTRVPTQGSRTVPLPRERCPASVLSTPKQPHRTEGVDPLSVSGRITAPGKPSTPHQERGLLAANVPGRHGPTQPLAPRRHCHSRATGHTSCSPAPSPNTARPCGTQPSARPAGSCRPHGAPELLPTRRSSGAMRGAEAGRRSKSPKQGRGWHRQRGLA